MAANKVHEKCLFNKHSFCVLSIITLLFSISPHLARPLPFYYLLILGLASSQTKVVRKS